MQTHYDNNHESAPAMSDLRAAAERYRKANTGLPKWLCRWEFGDAYLSGNIWHYLSDLEEIGKAYLAEHLADDGEPVTLLWLLSLPVRSSATTGWASEYLE